MRLDELAREIGASLLAPPGAAAPEVRGAYAGDRISDLLAHADGSTMLVSNLPGEQLVRVAQLMDAPICLVNDAAPPGALVQAAREHGACVLVSPVGLFETCGRVYKCLSLPEVS